MSLRYSCNESSSSIDTIDVIGWPYDSVIDSIDSLWLIWLKNKKNSLKRKWVSLPFGGDHDFD